MPTGDGGDWGLPAGGLASVKRRLLGGAGWALAGRVSFLASTVLMSALVTRLLAPEEAGTYFLAVSLGVGIATVAEMGLHRVAVRFIAEAIARQDWGRVRSVCRRVFGLGLLGGLLVSAVLVSPPAATRVIEFFAVPGLGDIWPLVALLVLVRTAGTLRGEIFRGFHDIRLASVFTGVDSNILASAVLAGVWVFAPHLGTLTAVMAFTVLAWLPGLAVGGYMLHRKVKPLHGDGGVRSREILATAWPLMILGVGTLLLSQADLWVVGATLDAGDVALYGASLRLLGLVSAPFQVVNAVVPPLIAELYAKGEQRQVERLLRVTATLAGIPAGLTMLVFVFGGSSVLATVYGPFYGAGGLLLAILSIGQLCNVWAGSCTFLLAMTGHERSTVKVVVTSATLMILGAIVAARTFGAPGVAVAGAAGQALKNGWMWAEARRQTGIRTHVSPTVTVRALRRQAGDLRRT